MMRVALAFVAILALGGAVLAESDPRPLSAYVWQNRVIVVFAESPDGPALERQLQALGQKGDDLRERDLVVVTVAGDGVTVAGRSSEDLAAGDLRRAWDISPNAFVLLLIGKDGGVKLRADEPVAPEEIFALIDTMPMRRREMRERSDPSS